MDGPFELATTAALAEVLRLDPRLAAEWERLRRALADLVPSDERGGWLLALGAAAGVPALVERRHMAEAWARLSDLAACPADAVARGPRRPRPTGWSRSSRPARDGPARARRPGGGLPSAGDRYPRCPGQVDRRCFRGLITRLPGQRLPGQGEDHLLAIVVEVDDLGLDLLAGRDHVGRLADPVRSEPADVDDALDSVPEIDVGE